MTSTPLKPPRYVVLQKSVGVTPLGAITEWKKANPQFADVPASYAGRLDPMASGTLLILLGKECKRQRYYTGLDKEYEIEVLLDISTDTGDVLGLATLADTHGVPEDENIRRATRAVLGTHLLPYPLFSSKTVNGKPLFLYALEGTVGEIEIPTHKETLYHVEYQGQTAVSASALKNRIDSLLARTPKTNEPSKELGANFRIEKIQEQWNELFAATHDREFSILRFRVTCASGAYMRTLANRIAATLGTRGLALSITRTKIGHYIPLGPFGFWLTTYH